MEKQHGSIELQGKKKKQKGMFLVMMSKNA